MSAYAGKPQHRSIFVISLESTLEWYFNLSVEYCANEVSSWLNVGIGTFVHSEEIPEAIMFTLTQTSLFHSDIYLETRIIHFNWTESLTYATLMTPHFAVIISPRCPQQTRNSLLHMIFVHFLQNATKWEWLRRHLE